MAEVLRKKTKVFYNHIQQGLVTPLLGKETLPRLVTSALQANNPPKDTETSLDSLIH